MSFLEFNKMGKRKERASSTHLSEGSDDECSEGDRRNGQIMMQGQSSKTTKVPNLNEIDPSVLKFSSVDPASSDFPLFAPSYEASLDQEEDAVPWRNSHPTDFPWSRELPSVTDLNKPKIGEACPFPRSSDSKITQSQSGVAKDSIVSKMHKFDAGQSSKSSGLANFSYFSRFASIPVANNVKPTQVLLPPKQSEAICLEDGKNDTLKDQSPDNAVTSGEKAPQPAMSTSSVCSDNRFKRASNDSALGLKRKSPETGDSESRSDEAEEESVVSKKTDRGRKGSKRSRALEVHNLSERRRRERINEKMRALQELLPNCNKEDKASMLDEAIEYLKALQLQVQVLSMGARMCMPPMMVPATMQLMHRAHVPQFLPVGIGMGMGMGMGFGMGMNGLNYGMAQMANTQIPNPTQELPNSTPNAPLPFSESPYVRFPGVVDLPHMVPSATSREAVENVGSRVPPSDQANKTSQEND